jgi:hypothetical protein
MPSLQSFFFGNVSIMRIFLFFISLLTLNCIQNLPNCPYDTLTLQKECKSEKEKDLSQRNLTLLAISTINSSALLSNNPNDSLTGKSLEFYNILKTYRIDGSYTLQNGTTRTFLNNSNCNTPIKDHTALNRAAQKHTENMIRYNLFSHTGFDGSTPTERVKREGLNIGAGENIAAGYANAEDVFNGWWNSSGHRANMENCTYTHIGVGFAEKSSINSSANFANYWTNKFAKIN